jgi:hypothetical protein
MWNLINATRALTNTNYASSNYRPGARPQLTGQQMQDDRRAAAAGSRNVRGMDGSLQRQMSPTEVNLNRAMQLANSGGSQAMLRPGRDRDLYNAGTTMMANMNAARDRARKSEAMERARQSDTLNQYSWNNQERNRMAQNWQYEDRKRASDEVWERQQRENEKANWAWQQEQRNWQKEMWQNTRNMLGSVRTGSGGGGASISAGGGGNFGVSGLR